MAGDADRYVRDNPWQSVAVAAGVASTIDLPHVPGVVLVGFAPGAGARERAAARARVGATARQITSLATDAEHWTLPRGLSTEAAMAALANNPALRYVEPDWILTATDTSNDPGYLDGSLWGMHGDGISPANQYGTGAAEAWAAGYTGSSSVVVAVLEESGFGASAAAPAVRHVLEAANGLQQTGVTYSAPVGKHD